MANSIAVANFYHRGRRETQKLHDLGNPDVGVSVPLVPLMVNGYVPGTTELLTVTLSVESPLVRTGTLKVAVTPAGSPLTPRFTVPVKPLWGVTVAVQDVLPP